MHSLCRRLVRSLKWHGMSVIWSEMFRCLLAFFFNLHHHHQSFNSGNDRTHLEIQYSLVKLSHTPGCYRSWTFWTVFAMHWNDLPEGPSRSSASSSIPYRPIDHNLVTTFQRLVWNGCLLLVTFQNVLSSIAEFVFLVLEKLTGKFAVYRYAGAMSREDADVVLQHRPNGTFLIRQSINPARRGELTLSIKSVISHFHTYTNL